jgi:hypothetical protein
MDRAEKKAAEAEAVSLGNARVVLHFCLGRGMTKQQSLTLATMGFPPREFAWFFKKAKGNYGRLLGLLTRRKERIERNRIESTLSAIDISGEEGRAHERDDPNAVPSCGSTPGPPGGPE